MNLETAKMLMGVIFRVSEDELKSIYRNRAKALHPDVSGNPNATKHFQELGQAYAYLKFNLNQLPPAPRPKPEGDVIYRVIYGKRDVIEVPPDGLKVNDLVVHFFYGEQEYRTVVKKGTELPMVAEFPFGLTIEFVRKEKKPAPNWPLR